jgi:nucleoside-diphosphate-sugar epimerase
VAKILITGGAGFIGSNLATELSSENEIVVLDDLSTGHSENLPSSKKIKFIKGDICDMAKVREALKGVQYVLHQAALPSVPRSMKDPVKSNAINAGGTLNLLFESSRAEVDRFVYASSSSVYGNTPGLPRKEAMQTSPVSPYAVSKLTGELYCNVFAKSFGLSTASLRYFNVFGPKQDPASEYSAVIPRFITAISKGEQPVIFGNGEQSRDFTYVSNIVLANKLAMESKKGSGDAFNIATGKSETLNGLVQKLAKALGKAVKPKYEAERGGDVMHSLADYSKARGAFGYEPKWDFDFGIKETVKWYSKG